MKANPYNHPRFKIDISRSGFRYGVYCWTISLWGRGYWKEIYSVDVLAHAEQKVENLLKLPIYYD